MLKIYDDYNVDDYDIATCYDTTIKQLTDTDREEYYQLIYDDLIRDLQYSFTPADTPLILQATRETHYPEYYKNNTIGYKIVPSLRDVTTIFQDYNIVEYDNKNHSLIITTIGHDNNYDIIARPLNKAGLNYLNTHNDYDLSHEQYETLFTKHTKQLKEIK